jgi:hypothetical protein
MKKLLLAIAGVLLLNFGMFAIPAYAANTGKEACEGYTGDFKEELCGKGGNSEANLQKTVSNVLLVVFGLLGILAVVFVIIGGFKFTTSQGDPGRVQQAKNTIMYSLIGLVISISAFTITTFILNALGG